ncbi:hypothetical protein [Iningainema tapete]|uniref:Uncharacterized protein n=1 Tax=Iningainema tapete BLCC-T55 TaxID=2748662 RepID=A0A8J6XE73_9CYAN|nr:hypothetical protein [Iningainema tapete]MBD2773829.1 hypothetical protein [Iningainema tapete BLCC-T55]
MTSINTLNQLPEGTQAALDLIAELDQCFITGFANLDNQHHQTLNTLLRIFTGTPLHQTLADACTAIQGNEFVERHFTVLAAVRAALQGSLFDTLLSQARNLLGRKEGDVIIAENDPVEVPEHAQVWLESVRHWLMEIALVGYARLDTSTLVHFTKTLEQIQAEPHLIRQAALLTGFYHELVNRVPIADSSTIPIYRWVDLWTQAMVGTLHPAVLQQPKTISGTLELLGLDLRHHAHLVSFTAYGLLTANASVQQVRITLSAYKVDVISGDQIWLLFPHATVLLDALTQNQVLHLNDVPLLPTGDLLWQRDAEVGSNYNLMKKAAEFFSPSASKIFTPSLISPTLRHPVQLAEPVFLSNYKTSTNNNVLTLNCQDGGVLPIATERISPLSELNTEALSKSSEIFGLLRFDAGRWAVQPLAATVQGKTIFTGQKAAKILKTPPKTSTVATLQERASRLLRKR